MLDYVPDKDFPDPGSGEHVYCLLSDGDRWQIIAIYAPARR
jgi:hypothetical protein